MTQLNEQPLRSSSELIEAPATELPAAPRWSDSPSICSLTDTERHLGHIVNAGRYWIAFDATRFNGAHSGFAPLGTFPEIASAKRAVEQSCRRVPFRQAFRTIH